MLTKNIICLVVTFNRCNYLKKCLKGLVDQTKPLDLVIVVDNGSSDATFDVVKEAQLKGLPIVYQNTKKNLGSAGGFEIGFQIASKYKHKWLWVMDDDVTADANCLEELLNNSHDCSVIQPYRYYNGHVWVKSECSQLNFKNPFKGLKSQYIQNPAESKDKRIACFPFEGPLISSEIVKSIAPPKKEYFIIGDDTEYSMRAAARGFKFKMCSTALMNRQICPVKGSKLNWKSYFIIRNNIAIDVLGGGRLFAIIRAFIVLSKMTLAAWFYRRTIQENLIIWQGTIDGVRGIYTDPELIIKKFK